MTTSEKIDYLEKGCISTTINPEGEYRVQGRAMLKVTGDMLWLINHLKKCRSVLEEIKTKTTDSYIKALIRSALKD